MTKTTDAAGSAQTNDAPAKKPHYATRDFKDAGTEREFAKGETLADVEAGSLINYVAAGLASTEKPEAAAQPA